MVYFIMIDAEDQNNQDRDPQKDQKGFVLMFEGLSALKAGDQGPGNSPDRGDEQKDPRVHGSQTQNVAEGVLRETGD